MRIRKRTRSRASAPPSSATSELQYDRAYYSNSSSANTNNNTNNTSNNNNVDSPGHGVDDDDDDDDDGHGIRTDDDSCSDHGNGRRARGDHAPYIGPASLGHVLSRSTLLDDDDYGHDGPGQGQGQGQESGLDRFHRQETEHLSILSGNDSHYLLRHEVTTSPAVQVSIPSHIHSQEALIHGNNNKRIHHEHECNTKHQSINSMNDIQRKIYNYPSRQRYHHQTAYTNRETSTCIKESVLDELNTIASHSLPVKDQIKINYANNIDRQLVSTPTFTFDDRTTATLCDPFTYMSEPKRCGRRSGRGWQCKNMRSIKNPHTIYCDYHREKIDQHHASWNARNKMMANHKANKKPMNNVKMSHHDGIKVSNSMAKANMSSRNRNLNGAEHKNRDNMLDVNMTLGVPHEKQQSKDYYNMSKSNTTMVDHEMDSWMKQAKDKGAYNSILTRVLEVARMTDKHKMIIMRPFKNMLPSYGVIKSNSNNNTKHGVKEMLPNLIEASHHVHNATRSSCPRQRCRRHQDSATTDFIMAEHEPNSLLILNNVQYCNNCTSSQAIKNGDDHDHDPMHKDESIDQYNGDNKVEEDLAYINRQNNVSNVVNNNDNNNNITLDDKLRCKRVDGRGWRCKKIRLNIMTADGLKQYGYCDHHHKLLKKHHNRRNLMSRSITVSKINSKNYKKKKKKKEIEGIIEDKKSINCFGSAQKTIVTSDKSANLSMLSNHLCPFSVDQSNQDYNLIWPYIEHNNNNNLVVHESNSVSNRSTVTHDVEYSIHSGIKRKMDGSTKFNSIASIRNHQDDIVIQHARIQKKEKSNIIEEEPLVNAWNLLGTTASIDRCSRMDGRGWRCKQSRVEGSIYCEHHRVKISHNHATWKASISRKQPDDMAETNNKLTGKLTSTQSVAMINAPLENRQHLKQTKKIQMMNPELQLSYNMRNNELNIQAPLAQYITSTWEHNHHYYDEIRIKENPNLIDDYNSGMVKMINLNPTTFDHNHGDEYRLGLRESAGSCCINLGDNEHDHPLVGYTGYDHALHAMRKCPKTKLLQDI